MYKLRIVTDLVWDGDQVMENDGYWYNDNLPNIDNMSDDEILNWFLEEFPNYAPFEPHFSWGYMEILDQADCLLAYFVEI